MSIIKFDPSDYIPPGIEIIGFVGCDGAGTTTHAKYATKVLELHGYSPHQEWMRFEHRLSIPVLGLARLLGLNELHTDGKHEVRAHTFEDSKVISELFKRTLVFDEKLMSIRKYKSIPQFADFLVCDRFILDALVDLIIATKELGLLNSNISNKFWNMIPSEACIIGLQCDVATLKERRADVAQDPYLDLRIEVYERLFQDHRVEVVDTSQPIECARNQVEDILTHKTKVEL